MTGDTSAYGSSWYAATRVAAPERRPLGADIDVDVCVIGAGLAGLSVAHALARRGWSVAVLESGRVAHDASGRNGGFVGPGFAERPARIVKRVGLDRARALWALSELGVEQVRTNIRENDMPGVNLIDGWLSVLRTNDPRGAESWAELVGGKLGAEVEVWPVDQVRAVLNSERYFQGLHFPDGFHIHPLNYALGLAAAAERAGARIFEQTPARAIDPAGVRKRVETDEALVRAGHVVLAGGPHLSSLHPLVAGAVLPVTTYIATTAPLGAPLREAVRYEGAVLDTRRSGDYYRIIEGDRLMWGGRISARLGAPRRLGHMLRRDLRKVYPQLRGVTFTHAWSGTMAYALHKMPLIGEVSPGIWVATAFGGHGLNTTAMAGELIASAIAEGDDAWRLFSSYDLVGTGGRFGRAASQLVFWSMRARDAVEERVARSRDFRRRRADAIAVAAMEEAKRRIASEQSRLAAELAERRSAAAQARAEAEAAAKLASEEAARLAAEEVARRTAEIARLAAEETAQHAAAEAARLAQAESERRSAEEAARRAAIEAHDQAADEAARHRAEEEAARLAEAEAARREAEETARAAAAEAARRAAEEQERVAAEKAQRRAAQSAARRAAREVARLAAEENARAEAEGRARQAAEAARSSATPGRAAAESRKAQRAVRKPAREAARRAAIATEIEALPPIAAEPERSGAAGSSAKRPSRRARGAEPALKEPAREPARTRRSRTENGSRAEEGAGAAETASAVESKAARPSRASRVKSPPRSGD